MVASSRRRATALMTLAVLSGIQSVVILGPVGVTRDSRMVASVGLELYWWLSR